MNKINYLIIIMLILSFSLFSNEKELKVTDLKIILNPLQKSIYLIDENGTNNYGFYEYKIQSEKTGIYTILHRHYIIDKTIPPIFGQVNKNNIFNMVSKYRIAKHIGIATIPMLTIFSGLFIPGVIFLSDVNLNGYFNLNNPYTNAGIFFVLFGGIGSILSIITGVISIVNYNKFKGYKKQMLKDINHLLFKNKSENFSIKFDFRIDLSYYDM